MSKPTLSELFAFERSSVALRALLQSYFDGERIVATLKINRVPATGALYSVPRLECDFSEGFLKDLLALAADDGDVKRFCASHGLI